MTVKNSRGSGAALITSLCLALLLSLQLVPVTMSDRAAAQPPGPQEIVRGLTNFVDGDAVQVLINTSADGDPEEDTYSTTIDSANNPAGGYSAKVQYYMPGPDPLVVTVVNSTGTGVNVTLTQTEPDAITDVNCQLETGQAVWGTVLDPDYNPAGSGVSVNVTINSTADGQPGNKSYLTTTDALGRYLVYVDYNSADEMYVSAEGAFYSGESPVNRTDNLPDGVTRADVHSRGPRAPTGLWAVVNGTSIELNWTASASPSVTHYLIFRSTTIDGFNLNTPYVNTSGLPSPLAVNYTDAGAGDGDSNDYFYIVRAVNNFYFNDSNLNKAGKTVNSLVAGWNLVSVPFVQLNTSTSSVLSTISGNYLKARAYSAASKTWNETGGGGLDDIDHKMGIWIYMNTADDLVTAGRVALVTVIQLYTGFNLVGYPSFYGSTPSATFSPSDYDTVVGYDATDAADPWKHNASYKPGYLNDLATMDTGMGYWVEVGSNRVWAVVN